MVAKLIFPDGKEFELTDEQFNQVKTILFPESVSGSLKIIEDLCGKYADGSDLTAWYLTEQGKEV